MPVVVYDQICHIDVVLRKLVKSVGYLVRIEVLTKAVPGAVA